MTDPAELKESKLFNDEHFAPSKTCHAHEFHHFSRLPLELRLWIWTLSLMHHRFIPIYFVKIGVDVEPGLAAMEFFRIRVPLIQCHMRICPEYDVLYLQGGHRAPFILADVLHDIRAFDPEDEGLMHLVLAHTDQPTFFDVAQPSDLLSGRARRNVIQMMFLPILILTHFCTNGVVLASSDFDDDGGRAAGFQSRPPPVLPQLAESRKESGCAPHTVSEIPGLAVLDVPMSSPLPPV
ncbi:pectinesterase precursor protein [Apiospora arundinis]|uniref:Pectinesterase protein n=1 Tax=Apiospora arundinis TaxID=335852 RepID=A0ABR2HZ88_9PEZI